MRKVLPQRAEKSVPFAVQIKPVGSECNMDCDYCYVKPFMTRKITTMPDNVLRRVIESCFAQADQPSFSWHGGEPLLPGLAFFERVCGFMEEFRQPHHSVPRNQIQTNATLITPEMAVLLAKHEFITGVSIDGPEEVHDLFRRYLGGQPSYKNAMRGTVLLRNAGLNPWVIATVTKATLPYPRQVFKHLVELGFNDLKFSAVFDPEKGEFGISSQEWLEYLTAVFECWLELEDPNIHVRELDEVIAWVSGETIGVCSSNKTCLQWVSVNPNGDLYPCEYFHTDYSYGNILQMELADIPSTSSYRNFQQQFLATPQECQDCQFLNLCGNGCPATRLRDGQLASDGVYAYCKQRQGLYAHIKKRFDDILSE